MNLNALTVVRATFPQIDSRYNAKRIETTHNREEV